MDSRGVQQESRALAERSEWQSGAGCRHAHDGSDPTGETRDVGRGQELRHAGIRPRTAGDEHQVVSTPNHHLGITSQRPVTNLLSFRLPGSVHLRPSTWMPHKTRASQASQIESSAALERLEKSRVVSTFVATNSRVLTSSASFRLAANLE